MQDDIDMVKDMDVKEAFYHLDVEYSETARVFLQNGKTWEFDEVSHEVFLRATNDLTIYCLNAVVARCEDWEDRRNHMVFFDFRLSNVSFDVCAAALEVCKRI